MRSMLLVPALFLLAGSANAGSVTTPIPFGVCGAMDVSDGMTEPGDTFDNLEEPLCQKLCKKAGGQCRGAVKDVASCVIRLQRQIAGYGLENCEVVNEDPADAKLCKQLVRGNTEDAVDAFKENRDDEIESCDDWADVCRASCVDP